MELRVGTSGFAYKTWKGKFYPEKHPDREMLSYYAEKLNAVEVNNTFYRMPSPRLLEGWAGKVPESFRFALKASRTITHFKRLKDAGDATEYLVRQAGTLGDRLGVLLFQLPPGFPKDMERLDGFLKESLPGGSRAAFEFRHASWLDEEVYDRLRQSGQALCIADADDRETPWVGTTNWGYLRLRRTSYTEDDLRSWVDRVKGQSWERAFVFFKHEDDATGPRWAMRFREMWESAE